MDKLHLSPNILDWAAARAGLSLKGLAEQVVAASRVERFLDGEMTLRQAETVAKKTRVPFGFLFLPTPPALEDASIPDLRQLPNPEPLSSDFKDLLDDIIRKQQWYAEYIQEIGRGELPFVGRYRNQVGISATEVAEDIRNTLGLRREDREACGTPEDFTNMLSELAEQAGILVFRSGFVRSNTRQGLSVNEFRGFALADPMVPVIFINGNDVPAAWAFTFAHEIAHIWLGASGVSDVAIQRRPHNGGIEARCNKIAAELLVPEPTFLSAWKEAGGPDFDALKKRFKVSRLVVARRALDFGLIEWEDYQREAAASKEAAARKKQADKEKDGGPTVYRTLPIRNSRRFTRALVNSAKSGETMLRDAGRLLNVTPGTVMEMGRRMAAGD